LNISVQEAEKLSLEEIRRFVDRPDLFITDMHSDMFEQVEPEREKLKDSVLPPETFLGGPPDSFIFGNALYHNLGSGKFEESPTV
jgi:hypothetical protein